MAATTKSTSTRARRTNPGKNTPVSTQAPEPEPQPSVDLDLDLIEREGGPKKPFTFLHAGRRYAMRDAGEIDWQQLIMALGNPHLFFRLLLSPADHKAFFQSHLPNWKADVLMRRFLEHTGMPVRPAADLGESDALPD